MTATCPSNRSPVAGVLVSVMPDTLASVPRRGKRVFRAPERQYGQGHLRSRPLGQGVHDEVSGDLAAEGAGRGNGVVVLPDVDDFAVVEFILNTYRLR